MYFDIRDSILQQSASVTSSPACMDLFDLSSKRSPIPFARTPIPPRFNTLEKHLHVAVLQNCLDQLYLLIHVFPLNEAIVRIKHRLDHVPLVDRMEDGFNETCETLTEKEKFQKDLYLIYRLIKRGMYEIYSCANYTRFVEKLDSFETSKEDEEAFFTQYASNMSYRQELKDLLANERKQFKKQLAEMDKRLNQATLEFGHQKNVMQNKVCYLEKWEESRQAQNERILSSLCEDYEQTIETFRRKTSLENVAHIEIETFLREGCEEYLIEVEKWSDTYQMEVEKRDMEIYNLKARRELLQEHFVALQKNYEERSVAITEWLACKEAKRKEEAEKLRIETAAIQIQAWWKGAMVRRRLERLKKKQKKGKGKGKKKEKGRKAKAKK